MKLELIDFISLFTFLQLLFLTFVIVNYKKGKRLSNSLLAGFMASNAMLIADFVMRRFGWISPERSVAIYVIGNSAYFLLTPFLYLYIRSLCYQNFRLKRGHLLHLTPFGIFVLFTLLNHVLSHTTFQTEVSRSVRQGFEAYEYNIHQAVLNVQIFFYLLASSILLVRYRERLRDMFSSIERIDLQWCNLLLAAFAAMWIMDLSNWIFRIAQLSSPIISYSLLISSLFINLAFTLVVTYKGLAQSMSFSGIQGLPKYAASRLTPSDCDNIEQRLISLMETDKPYLSPSISLEDISEKLNIPSRNLSQVINTRFNQNFFDFINSYRIEEIKKRMCDERSRNFTLVAIAYDAGFNSKSVFNAAFKKRTGMTPKEYRQQF